MTKKFAAFAAGLKARLTKLFEEYGRVAIVVYLILHAGVISASGYAMHQNFDLQTWGGIWALLVAVWVAAKASQIPRTLVTLAITPPVAKVWHRFFPKKPHRRETHVDEGGESAPPPSPSER